MHVDHIERSIPSTSPVLGSATKQLTKGSFIAKTWHGEVKSLFFQLLKYLMPGSVTAKIILTDRNSQNLGL